MSYKCKLIDSKKKRHPFRNALLFFLLGFGLSFYLCHYQKLDTYLLPSSDNIASNYNVVHKKQKKEGIGNAVTIINKKEKNDIVIPVTIDDNGIHVKMKVNGLPIDFILDTGCSDMQMSSAEFNFLIKENLIKTDEDFISHSEIKIANGDKVESDFYNIKSVEIKNNLMRNVVCNVVDNPNAPALLGQSVLSKLGKITIDYNKKLLIIQKL